MLRLLALLFLLHTVLAATSHSHSHSHRNVEQQTMLVVTSQPDKLSLRPSNDLHNDDADNDNNDKDDDDYYSDNEPSDDDEVQKSKQNWNRVVPASSPTARTTPTPTPTPVSSTPTPKTPSSLAWWNSPQISRRVPRQPQRLLYDNRVDGDAIAAFQEEEGYQSDQAVGAMTALKQQEVGTPEKVMQTRRRYEDRTKTQLRHLADAHRQRIDTEGSCRWPQRRLISINGETSKQYVPRATYLHRCDEYTGCCPESMVCTVKSKETVELAFWVLSTGSSRAQAMLVPLTNHTECECVNLAGQRRKRSSQCQCPRHFSNFSNLTWQRPGLSGSGTALLPSCRCDCHLNDATCQRMKNGEEGFAVSERRCILRNECSQPICNYGTYNVSSGRCPRSSQQQEQPQQRQLGFG